MSELIERLRTEGPVLSGAVIQRMYRENAFWRARFGQRGEKNAKQDGDFHVTYLIESLEANDPGVLTKYARWLQRVLVTRGMCTRHLADNYRLLAEAIGQQQWPEGDRAVQHLLQAEAALQYAEEPARAIQVASAELAREIVFAVRAANPSWFQADPSGKRWEDDCAYLLSYLADAAGLHDPFTFTSYVHWLTGFLGQQNVPHFELRTMLEVMGTQLTALLPRAASLVVPWVSSAARLVLPVTNERVGS